jgi:hypothetical protein
VEPLEDRLALATLTWTGQVSELWSDARNWAEDTTPYATPEADHLVFPRSGARRVSVHDGALTQISQIEFFDSGYIIRGGDLALTGAAQVLDQAPSGTNTLENRTITISTQQFANFANITAVANNTLQVSSTISGGGIVHLNPGTLALLGNNSYR